METITDLLQFFPAPNGCVLTIGVFDGVHRGHRAIINKARESADADARELLVFSFSPGPHEFFSGTDEGFYILALDEFKAELDRLGVDRLLLIPFDRAIRETRAGDFLDGIVRDRLDARTLVVGRDFAFGLGREGSIEFVQSRSKQIGLELVVIDELTVDGMSVRSTAIRELIRMGRVEDANKLLGYEFYIIGEVIPGAGVGKSIDCPTANIMWPKSKVKPLRGVYAVITELDGEELPAVANFGVRPTFEDIAPGERFEVHILGYDGGDLVGKSLLTRFIAFLREEIKFPSTAELASQIERDKQQAWELLKNRKMSQRR
jgi:riboflavin kinase/FMN adenylyltransferase